MAFYKEGHLLISNAPTILSLHQNPELYLISSPIYPLPISMLFVPRWHPRVRARHPVATENEQIVDYSGSDIESDEYIEEDAQDPDVEFSRFYDADYTEPLLSLVRFIPSPTGDPEDPPMMELWGTRPFGFYGLSVIWTVLRVEIDDEDVEDPDEVWRNAGINPEEVGIWHRVYARRVTPGENPGTPPNQPNPVFTRLWTFDPREPTTQYQFSIGTFWLYGIEPVTNQRDLRRITKKVNEHMNRTGE